VGALLAVLAVTTMNGPGGTGVNLMPGSGIRTTLNNVNRDLGLLNLVGNVVMFAPVGFLMPLATRLSLRGVVVVCVSLSVSVELLQLMLGRSLDVDDVLLNTFGGALGAAAGVTVAAWLRRRSPRPLSTTEGEVARTP
jgi:glycopeptide antibiotics resistance protein